MLVLSMVIGTMVPAFAFSDVEDTFYEDEINKLAAVGVVTGDPEGTFRPEDNITRAEVAVIICKMLGAGNTMDAQKNMPSKFSDVAVGEWYTGAINLATDIGVIAGFPDGTFRPNDNITTAQAVTLMVKALGRGAYVDAAGQWPANYIAEGAKLGVTKNVVAGSQDDLASRGMVAAMSWNSLDIPVWDVYETTHAGEIVSSATDTMLNLYFKDFVTDKKDYEGNLKWAEDVVVDATYLTDKEIAVGQIKVDLTSTPDVDLDIEGFEVKAADRVKNKEVKTYIDDLGDLVIYVADENVNVEELLNKKVDIMFGKDNVATLVVVREEAETDMLTKYLADDDKIVVGSETYKLAEDDIKVSINNVEVDDDATKAEAKTIIANLINTVTGAPANTKTITKAIKVNVGLTSAGKVEKLAFEVSGNFTIEGVEITQFIVKEIDDNKIEAIKESTDATIDIDIDELLDEENVIVVIKDGEVAELTDIVAGDVVTYTGDIETAAVMYVSSAKVAGTADKIKKTLEMTVDGTTYYANLDFVGDLSKDIEDAEDFADLAAMEAFLNDVVDEEVELYLNYLGEYVAVLAETEGGDYTFGIVKKVVDASTDVDEYDAVEVRILNENGESKLYNIVGDEEDVDLADIKDVAGATAGIAAAADLVNEFVAFKVTGENSIKAEDMIVIDAAQVDFAVVDGEDYSVMKGTGAANYDDEEIAGKEFNSDTVIFNIGGTAEDKMEIVKAGFKAIVAENDSTIVDSSAYIVYDENDDIKYIVLDGNTAYVSTESDYAYVMDMEMIEDDAYSVTLYVEGEEKVYETKGSIATMAIVPGDFIKYEITGAGKLDIDPLKTFAVIDVQGLSTLKLDRDLTSEFVAGGDLVLDASAITYDLTKKHITVDEVTTTTVKFDEIDNEAVANIKFERDDDVFEGIIYDLSDLEAPKMVEDIKDLEGKAVFAFNADKADAKADLFVIVKR